MFDNQITLTANFSEREMIPNLFYTEHGPVLKGYTNHKHEVKKSFLFFNWSVEERALLNWDHDRGNYICSVCKEAVKI